MRRGTEGAWTVRVVIAVAVCVAGRLDGGGVVSGAWGRGRCTGSGSSAEDDARGGTISMYPLLVSAGSDMPGHLHTLSLVPTKRVDSHGQRRPLSALLLSLSSADLTFIT